VRDPALGQRDRFPMRGQLRQRRQLVQQAVRYRHIVDLAEHILHFAQCGEKRCGFLPVVQRGEKFRAVSQLLGEDAQRMQPHVIEGVQLPPGLDELFGQLAQAAGRKILRRWHGCPLRRLPIGAVHPDGKTQNQPLQFARLYPAAQLGITGRALPLAGRQQSLQSGMAGHARAHRLHCLGDEHIPFANTPQRDAQRRDVPAQYA